MLKAPQIDQASIPKQANKAATLCTLVPGTTTANNPTLVCACDPTNPATQDTWVRTLVAAYNTALREVYAAHCPTLRPLRLPTGKDEAFSTWDSTQGTTAAPSNMVGSKAADSALRRWRLFLYPGKTLPVYNLLARAARTLHEKGIPPATWCRHVMERSRDWALGKGKSPKPLPIHVAYRCKDGIEAPNQRAMYYQERTDTGVTLQPQQVHHEQMYRLREANNRRRGFTYMMAFPPWYAELRARECAQGVEDPMTNFPAAGRGQ
jgi:hypothetical protein